VCSNPPAFDSRGRVGLLRQPCSETVGDGNRACPSVVPQDIEWAAQGGAFQENGGAYANPSLMYIQVCICN
jgi:hypothetical protein